MGLQRHVLDGRRDDLPRAVPFARTEPLGRVVGQPVGIRQPLSLGLRLPQPVTVFKPDAVAQPDPHADSDPYTDTDTYAHPYPNDERVAQRVADAQPVPLAVRGYDYVP
ncbi:MAG: hypothetical protein KIS87_08420 [Phycisphaeraceae bacterium]|nr:hypothetical protein [Phycisphaeraceae bacterium]